MPKKYTSGELFGGAVPSNIQDIFNESAKKAKLISLGRDIILYADKICGKAGITEDEYHFVLKAIGNAASEVSKKKFKEVV